MRKHKVTYNNELCYPTGTNMVGVSLFVDAVVPKLISLLPKSKHDYRIVIWCRGSSGAILGSILSLKLIEEHIGNVVFHVKKEGEVSHSVNKFTRFPCDFNILIDDFAVTGETVLEIRKHIGEKLDVLILESATLGIKIFKNVKHYIYAKN